MNRVLTTFALDDRVGSPRSRPRLNSRSPNSSVINESLAQGTEYSSGPSVSQAGVGTQTHLVNERGGMLTGNTETPIHLRPVDGLSPRSPLKYLRHVPRDYEQDTNQSFPLFTYPGTGPSPSSQLPIAGHEHEVSGCGTCQACPPEPGAFEFLTRTEP